MRRPFAALLAPVVLAGCAHSPATTILTIDAAPPAATPMAYRGKPIAIPAVHIPATLDRMEYVHQIGAGQVKIDDFARWAAPLGILARDTLVRDLLARLPAGAVLPPGSPGAAGRANILDVTILSIAAAPSGTRMDVAYRLLPDGSVNQISLETGSTMTTPVAAAQTIGTLLGQLADRIAAGVTG